MRVLVTGGRNFNDKIVVWGWLQAVHLKQGIEAIIHGGATGADALAASWARAENVAAEGFPALWRVSGGKIDRGAGPRRNQRMIDEGKPDLVIAFPGGTGTADCVRRAEAAGIRVIRVGETDAGAK